MNEQLEQYIETHIDAEPENLHRLYRRVNTRLLYPHMCSGHIQGRLLKMLVSMIDPLRVLEIGTYAGYSALCMAEGLQRPGARVDTIEIDDEMADFIGEQLAESPVGGRVRLIIGDALEIIPTLDIEAYDLVFVDANKRLYCDYYEALLPRLHSGAYIFADNTLWAGKVLDTEANGDAQTRGLARFNDMVAADTRVEKVILPLRDGLTLIRKK